MKHEKLNAVISRDAFTGKWLICRVIGDMIQGDEIARRNGEFTTKLAAIEEADRLAEELETMNAAR